MHRAVPRVVGVLVGMGIALAVAWLIAALTDQHSTQRGTFSYLGINFGLWGLLPVAIAGWVVEPHLRSGSIGWVALGMSALTAFVGVTEIVVVAIGVLAVRGPAAYGTGSNVGEAAMVIGYAAMVGYTAVGPALAFVLMPLGLAWTVTVRRLIIARPGSRPRGNGGGGGTGGGPGGRLEGESMVQAAAADSDAASFGSAADASPRAFACRASESAAC